MAIGLAQAGANVVVNGSHEEGSRSLPRGVRTCGVKAVAGGGRRGRCRKACAGADRAHHSGTRLVDVLINNAGIIRRSPAVDYSSEDWARLLEVNLNAVFRLSQLAGREMLAQGSGKS